MTYRISIKVVEIGKDPVKSYDKITSSKFDALNVFYGLRGLLDEWELNDNPDGGEE